MAEPRLSLQADREYETIFILKHDVTRESSESIGTRLADVVSREGGKLTRVENWGRRRLAYPVAKQKRGVYVYLKYIGRGGLVQEVERNLRLQDDVLKYLTVKTADEVEREAVVVAAEDVKFEHVEIPADAEADETLARELGLDHDHDRERDRDRDRDRRRDPYADDADEAGEAEVAAENAMGGEDD